MMSAKTESIYDFTVMMNSGEECALSQYKGQVLLIVNVASKCGFTPQYAGLEELYQSYREKGFTVLAFPCNQFGSQEPGEAQQIKDFCDENYNISFPLFDKINVNGADANPLFTYIKSACPGVLGSKKIKWNFTKFLVSKEGIVVKRYAPQDAPDKLKDKIEELL